MKHIDKTRDNIRVSDMEQDARKELFKKFVDAGGEVLQEKRSKPMVFDREKQKHISQKLDEHHRKITTTPRKKAASATETAVGNASNYTGGFADSIANKLSLFLSGVTNLTGSQLKGSFIDLFSEEYKNALIELQMIYLDIFKQNPVTGDKIIYQLDLQRPVYFELIEMTADLYDKTLVGQITDQHQVFPGEIMKTRDFQVPLLAYFKKLFPLYPYVDTIYIAYEKAISLQQKMEKDKGSSYSAKKKKASNSIYITFNRMLPKLYKLFCHYHGATVPLSDRNEIEQILLIGPDLKPGQRTLNAPSRFSENFSEISAQKKEKQENEKKEAMEELKKKQVNDVPEDTQRGLAIMNGLSLDSLRKIYLQNNTLASSIPENDLVMKAYLLFLEFDRQYSMILTTNKIKFSVIYDKNEKRDYRIILNEIFNSMRGCHESVKQYFGSVDNTLRYSAEQVSKDYYLNHQKKIMEMEKESRIKAMAARNSLRNFMDNLNEQINVLLNDTKGGNRIILNPNDLFLSDGDINVNMKLEGKSIAQALSVVGDYSAAFLYRITGDGDLNKEPLSENNTAKVKTQSANEKPISDYNPNDASILSELDKLDDNI